MFYDTAQLFISAGKGGDGAVSFRREKYLPKGGPDGGDGGRGGDVYIVASREVSDLSDYISTHHFKAEDGVGGMGRKLHGRRGQDLTLRVPLGTHVWRKVGQTWQHVGDMTRQDDPFRLLVGGEGGLGNVHFATPTHQAPRHAQSGKPGGSGQFRFDLEIIADVGLIGLPNAGKSTLLSVLTGAKPKVANYPFTTLSPVLGVLEFDDSQLIIAEIPGLIAGASRGKGLGHTFLRHSQRTKLLVHLIDSTLNDVTESYRTIRHELAAYDQTLAVKPELVVLTKGDLSGGDLQRQVGLFEPILPQTSHLFSPAAVSAATGQGIADLKRAIVRAVSADS